MAGQSTKLRTSILLAIVHFFIELSLLQRKPQDLPASPVLLALMLGVGLLGGVLLSITAGANLWASIGQKSLDLLLMLGALHLGLKLTGKLPRFLQTATALVGADTLIGILLLVPVGLAGSNASDSEQLVLAGLMIIALLAWSVAIGAHILRNAFDIKLIQGAIIVVVFYSLSFLLVGGLTQGAS